MSDDKLFMRRALDLAKCGLGYVRPNPMVGCVIVYNNLIIGEGYHQNYGQAHAEVNAIQSVKDKSLISKSTIYITLEPCVHHGKTPPCVDLILQYLPQRIVICNKDSNPLVGGKGIQRLKDAGIQIQQDVLKEEGRILNKRFFTFMEKKRPFIVLKWAETADGFIARANNDSKWISNELSRKLVHKWRSEEHGIIVGTRTAEYDNPQLNIRDWEGNNPIRMVVDRTCRLSYQLHLFDQKQPTLCYNEIKNESIDRLQYIKLDFSQSLIAQLIQNWYDRHIQSVIVEGGAFLLQQFIDSGCWDEIRQFKSQSSFFKNGIKAPLIQGKIIEEHIIKQDRLTIYHPVY